MISKEEYENAKKIVKEFEENQIEIDLKLLIKVRKGVSLDDNTHSDVVNIILKGIIKELDLKAVALPSDIQLESFAVYSKEE